MSLDIDLFDAAFALSCERKNAGENMNQAAPASDVEDDTDEDDEDLEANEDGKRRRSSNFTKASIQQLERDFTKAKRDHTRKFKTKLTFEKFLVSRQVSKTGYYGAVKRFRAEAELDVPAQPKKRGRKLRAFDSKTFVDAFKALAEDNTYITIRSVMQEMDDPKCAHALCNTCVQMLSAAALAPLLDFMHFPRAPSCRATYSIRTFCVFAGRVRGNQNRCNHKTSPVGVCHPRLLSGQVLPPPHG